MSDKTASVMGLDIGEARIGIALATWPDGIPSPLTALANDPDLSSKLSQIIKEQNVKLLVFGRPRSLNGADTAQTTYTLKAAEDLKAKLNIEAHLQDEALTSVKAEDELRSRKKPYTKGDIDSLSAVYILEDFLKEHPGGLGIEPQHYS